MKSIPFFDDRFPVRTVYTDMNDCKYVPDDAPVTVRSDLLLDHVGDHSARIVYAKETHSGTVVSVTDDFSKDRFDHVEERLITKETGGFDSVVTSTPGVMMCITTADCLPLFLYDPVSKTAAITHCGWRGIASAIITSTTAVMKDHHNADTDHIVAAIGPCICGNCYEVGEELIDDFSFCFSSEEINTFFAPKGGGKYLLDIRKAAFIEMKHAGIRSDNIFDTGVCTYESDDYVSYRRVGKLIPSHQMISGIILPRTDR